MEAAVRQGAIREAGIRAARKIPNPDISGEVSRDVPHEILSVDVPIELGGKRGRRIDLAREELTLADVDLQAGPRAIRQQLRQALYSLVGGEERGGRGRMGLGQSPARPRG